MIRLKHIFFLTLIGLHFVALAQTNSLKDVQTELDSIYTHDQTIRFEIMKMQKEGKLQTDEFIALVTKMKRTDADNLNKIKAILDRYGWPNDLTDQGNQTIFLVIQHADIATQREYLPLIKKAVEDKKILPSNLAILEDRIALRSGEKQIYGSQVVIDQNTGIKYVAPLIDPDGVNQRRKSVGLPTMEEYLKQSFQMSWSLDQYNKDYIKANEVAQKMINQ
ncbi:hypothetical protein GCM10009117_16790 [Gangjinia marincola]|uniref:Uncharacterized protein n=2 Tax=Gangjinia marincola TaxID=578463 RepID=A0ABP3XTN2_9FLAO